MSEAFIESQQTPYCLDSFISRSCCFLGWRSETEQFTFQIMTMTKGVPLI